MTEHTTTGQPQAGGTTGPTGQVELTIGGMTCASCAARIEKKLNRLDGVTATVNYATDKATVSIDPGHGVSPDQLVAVVEGLGYGASLPRTEPDPSGD